VVPTSCRKGESIIYCRLTILYIYCRIKSKIQILSFSRHRPIKNTDITHHITVHHIIIIITPSSPQRGKDRPSAKVYAMAGSRLFLLLSTLALLCPALAFTAPMSHRFTKNSQLKPSLSNMFANTAPSRNRNPPATANEARLSMSSSGNEAEPSGDDQSSNNNWLFGLCLPLWLAYVSNQWSRSSIYYLVDFSEKGNALQAMNVDLDFSQAQYGLLASVAFTSLFAVSSLVAGAASDRYNRKLLTVASIVTWGIATLGTSLSTSYEQVVMWRVLMGLSCAFSTPTAYTLLADRVPADKGATASSIYSTGVALGGALASLSILLDTQIGWRNTALVISLFAFGSAIINLVVLEDDPKEDSSLQLNGAEEKKAASASDDESSSLTALQEVQQVLSSNRVQLLFLASFLRFCSGLLIGVWSAPYFRQLFPDNASDYAIAQAAITATCGIISGLIGGAIADRIMSASSDDETVDKVGRQLWVPVAGNLLATPAWYMAITSENSFQLAMVWLAVEYLVAECWFGPTVAVLQSSVGKKIGGTAQGLFTVTGAIGNLAPALLGFVYDQQHQGAAASPNDLTNLLAISVCSCYILSAFCFGASALSDPPAKPKLE
jgi:MFS family permease